MYEAAQKQEPIGWGVPSSTWGLHLLQPLVRQAWSLVFFKSFIHLEILYHVEAQKLQMNHQPDEIWSMLEHIPPSFQGDNHQHVLDLTLTVGLQVYQHQMTSHVFACILLEYQTNHCRWDENV